MQLACMRFGVPPAVERAALDTPACCVLNLFAAQQRCRCAVPGLQRDRTCCPWAGSFVISATQPLLRRCCHAISYRIHRSRMDLPGCAVQGNYGNGIVMDLTQCAAQRSHGKGNTSAPPPVAYTLGCLRQQQRAQGLLAAGGGRRHGSNEEGAGGAAQRVLRGSECAVNNIPNPELAP